MEDEPGGVQGLTGEGDRAELVGAVDVAALADQGVAAEAGLDADLVAAAGLEADFEARGVAEALDHLVVADRLLAAGVARMRFLLDERGRVPDEMIAPG